MFKVGHIVFNNDNNNWLNIFECAMSTQLLLEVMEFNKPSLAYREISRISRKDP